MRLLRALPFMGRLSDCSAEDRREAFVEVLLATLFSTMPLWFLPLLSGVFFLKPVTGYDAIRTGELFLFSTALVGPLGYIISKNYGEKSPVGGAGNRLLRYSIKFPYGAGFIFACVAICLVSSFAFLVLRNPFFQSSEISKLINYDGVISLSWFTFCLSTLILFCAMSYRNGFDSIARTMSEQERSFAADWEAQK
ncbi:hypothetical protein [Rhizorhabdus sp. FW153]|uniref:hypothetical protein n=1 Tax=Rhizorhabdus sp. FW153 TaxID=3400216 RepID=UPI003CEB2C55